MKMCEKCLVNPATRIVSGMHLCDGCAFHEENMQCYKCQLYLPKVELVLWRGQWYCPYCILEIRTEEARHEIEPEKEGLLTEEEKIGETKKGENICEVCGTPLIVGYIINGRKLCRSCKERILKPFPLFFKPFKISQKAKGISIVESSQNFVNQLKEKARALALFLKKFFK